MGPWGPIFQVFLSRIPPSFFGRGSGADGGRAGRPVWPPGSRPQSQLCLPVKHTPPPGTSLIFHPWGCLTVGDRAASRGGWASAPRPRGRDRPHRSVTSRPCDPCRGRTHNCGLISPRGGWPSPTGTQRPEPPARHTAAGRPRGAPARGWAALWGRSRPGEGELLLPPCRRGHGRGVPPAAGGLPGTLTIPQALSQPSIPGEARRSQATSQRDNEECGQCRRKA